MPRISAFFTNNGVPLTSPTNTPTIRIRRQDTQALVVTDAAMTEQGDGIFSYDFTEDSLLEYVFRCDGDPTAAGQVTPQERYVTGAFSGITEARVETDIPAILVDTGTSLPAEHSTTQGLVTAVAAAVANVDGDLVAHDGKLDGHITALATHDGKLDNLDADLVVHDGKLDGHITALATHEGNLATHNTLLVTHNGALLSHDTAIQNLLTTLQTDVDGITDLLEATSEIDEAVDPWVEKWIRQSDSTVLATFELYDENLNAINAGNPLTGKRVRRRKKV